MLNEKKGVSRKKVLQGDTHLPETHNPILSSRTTPGNAGTTRACAVPDKDSDLWVRQGTPRGHAVRISRDS
jgi:hypothetical protein